MYIHVYPISTTGRSFSEELLERFAELRIHDEIHKEVGDVVEVENVVDGTWQLAVGEFRDHHT